MNSFSDSTRKSGFQLFAKVTPPYVGKQEGYGWVQIYN